MRKKRIRYADDDITPVRVLFKLRTPSLVVGLVLGLVMSFITSRFEEALLENIALAFFLPLIVYLSDAIGTQTQTIYARDLRTGKASFKRYLIKETFLGIFWGLAFSIISSLVIFIWFKSITLTLTVGISTFFAVATAPLIALIITKAIYSYREDPAIGSGPIATVIQDVVSIVIYGYVASAIIL